MPPIFGFAENPPHTDVTSVTIVLPVEAVFEGKAFHIVRSVEMVFVKVEREALANVAATLPNTPYALLFVNLLDIADDDVHRVVAAFEPPNRVRIDPSATPLASPLPTTVTDADPVLGVLLAMLLLTTRLSIVTALDNVDTRFTVTVTPI